MTTFPRTRLAEAIATPDPGTAGGRTQAARGALWLSAGSWGAKVAQTVVLLVLAKALAPSQFGILAIAALTYNVLSAHQPAGRGRRADLYTGSGSRRRQGQRFPWSLPPDSLLMVLTWAFAPVIASFFHSPHATFVIRGFAVCLPFDASAQVPIGRLTRALSFRRRAVTDSLPSVIRRGCHYRGGRRPATRWSGWWPGRSQALVANAAIAFLLGPRCLPGWDPVLARQLLEYGG